MKTLSEFTVKDSGKRQEFESGMVRDTTEGKIDPLLVRDGPMYQRWVVHLVKGAVKYAKRNWMLAAGQEEYDRFRESAARHFDQWLNGERDEDHAAAVFFNINGAEYVREKLGIDLLPTFEEAWEQYMDDVGSEVTELGNEYTLDQVEDSEVRAGHQAECVDPLAIPADSDLTQAELDEYMYRRAWRRRSNAIGPMALDDVSLR